MGKATYKTHLVFLLVLLVLFFIANLSFGSVFIPFKSIINILLGDDTIKQSWQHIILNYRLPKAITATVVGAGLSICGLLMQTLFRNPLAGPFVLGISSGASLGVAILVLGLSFIGGNILIGTTSNLALVTAASIGALFVLSAVMLVSRKVKNTMSILIIGL
ncbi:MAG: iron chelate uptake ABC transporter family permease subunit, partial [Flavobacteriaceae bacterium]|nr:iron chelate uptake ABC transporter family permease subunit [Flavobacteriaceae bacterium]